MTLPPEIAWHLSESLGGARIGSVTPISGGMISCAARVETDRGPVFVKWHDDAPGGMFGAEASGLLALYNVTKRLRVPKVFTVLEGLPSDGNRQVFLAMEYIQPHPIQDRTIFTRRLAEGLADLHKQTLRVGKHRRLRMYGFGSDGFIGMLPQPNRPRTTDWAVFYRDSRLLPQIEIARQNSRLSPEREWLLQSVLEKLPDLLADMPPESSLLHGDLWSGNFLCAAGDEPVLIDPAAYNGPREMEIAFIELFGGFPPGFVAAYNDAFPLDPGYPRRRTLHQIYPLLVHLNHFGERYGPAVESACLDALRGSDYS